VDGSAPLNCAAAQRPERLLAGVGEDGNKAHGVTACNGVSVVSSPHYCLSRSTCNQ